MNLRFNKSEIGYCRVYFTGEITGGTYCFQEAGEIVEFLSCNNYGEPENDIPIEWVPNLTIHGFDPKNEWEEQMLIKIQKLIKEPNDETT